MLIPNKHNGYTRDGVRRVFFDGGGGGGGQTTSYTTNVPEYAKEPFMEMIGKGVALSEAPYQAYGGERTAQFTPLQRQAFGQAENQRVAGQIGQASGIAGLAAQQGLQAGQFQPGTFAPMGVQAPQLQQFQMGPAQRVSSQSFAQPGAAEQFMNPYMQQVVGIQQREAQRQADIAGTQRGAQAVRAGAFGGSRQAIMDAEAQRSLAQQMGDIQATGSQAAFQQAQQQFNQEQQARLQAQMANQQAGLTVGQQNLGALLGIQQLGAGQNLQSQMANQQALMDAQRAFEQSRQFGADIGLRGGAQALQGAQTLGQLGQQQFGQEMDIMGARQQMGGTQQQQIQRILDQQYADFQAQRDFPYQQLGFMSDLLRGTGSSTRTVFQSPQPNQMAQLAGAGLSAYGLMRAEGGEIPAPKKYAAGGGITGLLPDQQLQERMASPTVATIAKMAAEKELMDRAQLRTGIESMQQGVPQMPTQTVAEEMLTQMGIGGLPVPDEVVPDAAMAGGGIVAFSSGDAVRTPYTPRKTSGQRMLDDFLQRGMSMAEAVAAVEALGDARGIGEVPLRMAEGIAGAVGDVKALPMSPGYLSQRERDEQAREERRRVAREEKALRQAADPRAGRGVNRNVGFDVAADLDREAQEMFGAGPTGTAPAVPGVAPQAGIAAPGVVAPGAPGAPATAPVAQGIASLTPAARMAEVERLAGSDQALRDQARTMGESEVAAREEYMRSLQADQAEGAEFWTNMRKKVEDKVEGLSKQEYDAKTNQMLAIGASLMANQSPNFGVAVGEALGTGVKLKREDEERLRAAKDALDARQDELAALERGEKRGDKKELREARLGVNTAKTALERTLFELDKSAFDNKRSLAKDVVEAVAREQSAERIASTYVSGRAGTGQLTPKQRADLANNAARNVQAALSKDPRAMMRASRDPAYREELIRNEFNRLLRATGVMSDESTLEGAPAGASPDPLGLRS
jgi:hypothetical protein